MRQTTFSLPLVDPSAWEGFRPVGATAAPQPEIPQGEYAREVVAAGKVPRVGESSANKAELLAPAGGPEAAFAAFSFGADAVYLGLKKFSARAEAENFTLVELAEVIAYAHQLQPRRKVFVAVNTVIRNDELQELIETLGELVAVGVDAVIVQDLGVYWLVRRYFPELTLHASTQLAVHNGAGAKVLARLGFSRVVLARELTLEEIADITGSAPIETEVFVHGALCYSYSGLCLFSSQTLGRSGNRGKCAYSCRDQFTVIGAPVTLRDGSPVMRDPRRGLPFSMKDLALPDHVSVLQASGVSCFKIEGRKKSALYVAATTDFYRKQMDGSLGEEEKTACVSDLQAAFGRPWTGLFMDSHRDKEVADRDLAHHRGVLIGRIVSVHRDRRKRSVQFRTNRALVKHDGLLIDPSFPEDANAGSSIGFGIRKMCLVEGDRRLSVERVEAGDLVEVSLPQHYRNEPPIAVASLVYCTFSKTVSDRYPLVRSPGVSSSETATSNFHTEAKQRGETVWASVGSELPERKMRFPLWSLKIDRSGYLDELEREDFAGMEEITIDIARDPLAILFRQLELLDRRIGKARVRLALPALTRKWEEGGLVNKIRQLREAGWTRWEASNLSAWDYLGLDPVSGDTGELDLAADWPLYVTNRLACRQLLDMGVTRWTLSPEDGLNNLKPTLAEFGDKAVLIVYQDTPMFQAESCAYANLIGGCPGKANCRFESMEMISAHQEKVLAVDYHCRTIVLNQGPFCLAPRLADLSTAGAVSLRVDFIFRHYDPGEVKNLWRMVRRGENVPGGHSAHFDRGLE